MMAHCSDHLTDGYLGFATALEYAGTVDILDTLHAQGFIDTVSQVPLRLGVAHDDVCYVQIVAYLKHNRSRAAIEASRNATANRKQKWRESKAAKRCHAGHDAGRTRDETRDERVSPTDVPSTDIIYRERERKRGRRVPRDETRDTGVAPIGGPLGDGEARLLAELTKRTGLGAVANPDEARALYAGIVTSGVKRERVIEILDAIAPKLARREAKGEIVTADDVSEWFLSLASKSRNVVNRKPTTQTDRREAGDTDDAKIQASLYQTGIS
jgi:hypothetical protein